jgi:hypothetical protein
MSTRLDHETGTCLVRTYREGVLSPIGHDLVLRVGRFEVGLAPGRVEGRFDAASLAVDGPSDLGASDRRKIEARIRDEVLDARRHPEVVFTATRIDGPRLDGTLMVRGVSRPMTFVARETGGRLVARAEVRLSDHGIPMVTAFFGALRVRDEVEVEISLPAGAASGMESAP